MVRHVFSNAELPHQFVHELVDWGRSTNMSFEGRVFKSYNVRIAAIRENDKGDKAIFINADNYSPTTNSHISSLRRAIPPDLEVIEYKLNYGYPNDPDEIELDSLLAYYSYELREHLLKADRCRKAHTRGYAVEAALEAGRNYNRVIDWFGATIPKIDLADINADAERLRVEAEAALEAERIRRESQLRAQREADKEQLGQWLKGKGYFPYSYNGVVYLRVHPDKPNMVQTSRGAEFPLKVCQLVYSVYKSGRELDRPIKAGAYEITSISSSGLRAGCHWIEAEEIERFAGVLGLVDSYQQAS